MKIKEWGAPSEQMAQIGKHHWSVCRLFELARNLPVMEVPLDHLSVWHYYQRLTMRELVMHIKAIEAADLNMPIILDEDGEIMDGRHRVMKCMWLGIPTIKAVRFDENPSPCRVDES
jgi:hypothetical protein